MAATGCMSMVTHDTVQVSQLKAAAPGTLKCGYRLEEVVDARGATQAGGLSAHAFDFAEAADVARRQLQTAGFRSGDDKNAVPVRVRIVQLYLTQNLSTKVPVAVYRVQMGDDAPVLLRAQQSSMNWNGTRNEAYDAYSAVLGDIHRQVIATLNHRCPTG